MSIDVIVDPEVFVSSKIHATIIEKIRQKMIVDPDPVRARKGNKWQENQRINNTRFAVYCKKQNGKIVIKSIRKLRQKRTTR